MSLLRGFSVSVQFSSSDSKNLWRNSFKSGVHEGKQLLSKTVAAILQKICGSYVMKDLIFLVPISEETKM